MLSLQRSIVEDHWKKTSPRMAKAVSVMEGVEHWRLDERKEVDEALKELVKSMNKTSRDAIAQNSQSIIYVMAYLSSGKSLRMMNWFDEKFPSGLTVEITDDAKNDPDSAHARLLLDRLQTIKSLSLMTKVFAPNRSRLILEILKSQKN